jgi:hypothetical protein
VPLDGPAANPGVGKVDGSSLPFAPEGETDRNLSGPVWPVCPSQVPPAEPVA